MISATRGPWALSRIFAPTRQESPKRLRPRLAASSKSDLGSEYRPEKPYQYKSRAGAQAAHEAIRPTSVYRRPEDVKPYLTRDQYRLYKLIWERFVASQMSPAVFDTVTVDIEAEGLVFRATGSTLKFPGFMTVYIEGRDDDKARSQLSAEQEEEPDETKDDAPPLEEGEPLVCRKIEPHQHFTQPPPRYTEAMLVKTLEELGIGRPSTYVQIMDTIERRRGYVTLVDKRFAPTQLGRLIVDLLKEYFPDIVDVEFTAQLEERLDRIEEGEADWRDVLQEFYVPFEAALEQAKKRSTRSPSKTRSPTWSARSAAGIW